MAHNNPLFSSMNYDNEHPWTMTPHQCTTTDDNDPPMDDSVPHTDDNDPLWTTMPHTWTMTPHTQMTTNDHPWTTTPPTNVSSLPVTHSSHLVHLLSGIDMTGGGTNHSTRSVTNIIVSGSGAMEFNRAMEEDATATGGVCYSLVS